MGGVSNRTNLRVHFAHHHVRDTITILEEVNRPNPPFPKSQVQHVCVAQGPQQPALCNEIFRTGEESKRRRLEEEKSRAEIETATTVYGITLTPVTSFKYLGIFLLELDDDWTLVVHNLHRAYQKWAQLSRVLNRE